MSNRRYIELSSSNRNRNQYPNPAEFEVPFSPSRSLNKNVVPKGSYTNLSETNQLFAETLDVADPVTNGIIEQQWYGVNGLYNSGVVTNVSFTGSGIYSYTLSVSLINSSLVIGDNLYINDTLLGPIKAGSTTSLIYVDSSVVITIQSVFVIVNNVDVIDTTTLQSAYSSSNGISSFYVNVSGLTCPYKNLLNYYTGYMLNIVTSLGWSQAGIIKSYTPSIGLFTVITPLLTTQTWSGGANIKITDPSNCTSSPIISISGGTSYTRKENTLVLPYVDSSGKDALDYDQAYNGYYAVYENPSFIDYSKVASYDFLTNTLTLENEFKSWTDPPSKPIYTLRKTLPNQKLIIKSVKSFTSTTSSASSGKLLNISTSLPTFNYNGLIININGEPSNKVYSYTSTVITLENDLTQVIPMGTNFTVTLQYNSKLSLDNCIFLENASDSDNYYNGQYIYVYPQQTCDNKISSLSNIQGTCYYINSYIGNGRNACFVSPVNPPELNGSTEFFPSYNSINFNVSPNAGLTINIVSFLKDNYTPLIYNGSVVSQNETVAYEISLVNLTIPNITLESGSRLAYYPYVYVELSNVTASSSSSKNVIYSNNPNSNRALFLVPITDITDPLRSPFIKLDAGSMVQTVKFKPNDCLRFSVFLSNGKTIRTVSSDYYNPSPPNPLVQIDALFGIKRL